MWVSSTKKEKKSGRQRRRRSEAARVYVISDNKWGPRGRVPVPRSLAAITAIQFIYLYILHPKYIYTYFYSGILSGKNYNFFLFLRLEIFKNNKKKIFSSSKWQTDGRTECIRDRIYRFSTRATFPPPCCKYCAVYNIHTHTQAGLCVQHLWTTGWAEMGLFQSLIEHQSRWTVLILHLNIFITCLSSIYIVYLLACSYQVYEWFSSFIERPAPWTHPSSRNQSVPSCDYQQGQQ